MLQKDVKKAWGPKPTYIRWIYTAIVRPKLTYAAISWGHSTRFATRHAALDKPVKTMEILYNLIPLHLYILYEAIASLSCNKHCPPNTWSGSNPCCKTYIGHRKYWHDALTNAQLSLSLSLLH